MEYKINEKIRIKATGKTGRIIATYDYGIVCVFVDNHYEHLTENEIKRED